MTATSLSSPVSARSTLSAVASVSTSSEPKPSSRNSAPRREPERLCSSTSARARARDARKVSRRTRFWTAGRSAAPDDGLEVCGDPELAVR